MCGTIGRDPGGTSVCVSGDGLDAMFLHLLCGRVLRSCDYGVRELHCGTDCPWAVFWLLRSWDLCVALLGVSEEEVHLEEFVCDCAGASVREVFNVHL